MNICQMISATMTTGQAVLFWLFVFIAIICTALLIVGKCLVKKEEKAESAKSRNDLLKENAELAKANKALRELYRKEWEMNCELRNEARK